MKKEEWVVRLAPLIDSMGMVLRYYNVKVLDEEADDYEEKALELVSKEQLEEIKSEVDVLTDNEIDSMLTLLSDEDERDQEEHGQQLSYGLFSMIKFAFSKGVKRWRDIKRQKDRSAALAAQREKALSFLNAMRQGLFLLQSKNMERLKSLNVKKIEQDLKLIEHLIGTARAGNFVKTQDLTLIKSTIHNIHKNIKLAAMQEAKNIKDMGRIKAFRGLIDVIAGILLPDGWKQHAPEPLLDVNPKNKKVAKQKIRALKEGDKLIKKSYSAIKEPLLDKKKSKSYSIGM